MGKHFSFGFKTENIIFLVLLCLVFVNSFCFDFFVLFLYDLKVVNLGFWVFFILIAKKSYQDRLKSTAKFTSIIYIYISIINILHNDGLHRTLWQTTRLELIHIHRILLNILIFVCMENSFIVYVFFLFSCSSLLLLLLILLFVLIWCAY